MLRAASTDGSAFRARCVLAAECQKAQARKRSSRAPPCRTEDSCASAPLMLTTIALRLAGPSAAIAVCVQPDQEVPHDPTLPSLQGCRSIHCRASYPSSASGSRKFTSPSDSNVPRQSWYTATYPRCAKKRPYPTVRSTSLLS